MSDIMSLLKLAHTKARDDLPSNRFEAQCLRRYLANALSRPLKDRRGRANREVAEWLREHGERLGLGIPDYHEEESLFDGRMSVEDSQKMARTVLPHLKSGVTAAPSPLEKRLCWIASTLSLNALDASILKLAARAVLFPPVYSLATAVGGDKADDEIGLDAITSLLGQSKRAIRDRLRRNRPLLQFGLLEDRNGGDFAPSATVMRLARLRRSAPERMRGELFGRSPAAALAWDDFDHLGEARDLTVTMLGAALERHEPGIGILLYGDPGTGKTEFAKSLAAKLNARAVFIGESDDDNGEPARSERVSHFAMTSILAAQAGRTILVVDEADDIFTGVDEDDHASRTGSKVFMNRLVERCAAPTIWITNARRRLGPAVMRRMTFAIEFREPGRALRRRMVQRLASKRKLRLSGADLDRLAMVNAAPALVDAGLRAAALVGGGAVVAIQGATSLLAALGRTPPLPALAGAVAFDPALSAADCDLTALVARAQASFRAGETALSFCFHGLPGTGKSACARFIAETLGLEVIEKRASDLLSMWLGGSEQNIAAAFTDAADRRAMLIIDEADSLLRDRAGAQRGWEVSQVNEMLTWMERHPYPFVCTTNAMAALDPATLRRFLFKVEFMPMSTTQARDAFRRAFAQEAPLALDRLNLLTPGDFAVVARKARVLGERDAPVLATMLAAEVAVKPEGRQVRIGF